MTHDDFATQWGFERREVNLSNWREAPWSSWAFHHVSELVPSARIAGKGAGVEDLVGDPQGLFTQGVDVDGITRNVSEIMATTSTDALVVLKNGIPVADYFVRPSARQPHIVFSISKSITGLLAGIAMDDGSLDSEAAVTCYVPEVGGTVFGDATVRHLLDMMVSLDFDEDYRDTEGNYARYRRAVLWNPSRPGDASPRLVDFLSSLKKRSDAHGTRFSYRSPVSDMLALVIERATGQRYMDFASLRLWKPIGAVCDALITVDAFGSPRGAGGISMTAMDLARVGELLRRGGIADSGVRVVSGAWVADTTIHGGSADAWRAAGNSWLPDGRYRNQWYQTGFPEGSFVAIGVHGQWLYVDPSSAVVIAKLSSQPDPVDDAMDQMSLRMFRSLSQAAV